MDDDDELMGEFLVESYENLDQLDRDLVALERAPSSPELLSSIFRAIHTIKGTSGFLALNRLEALTHGGENLLSKLRDGDLVMDSETTEVLLAMIDGVRGLLELIEHSGTDEGDSVAVEPIIERIRCVLEPGVPAEPAAAGEPEPEPEIEPEPEPEPVFELDLEPAYVLEPDLAVLDEADPTRKSVVDATVRVDVELLDSLVQLVGELVLTRNQILQRVDSAQDADLLRASQRLNLVASELQEGIMKTRMQPIGQIWSKMPRIVRDLAAQLGRKVALEMEGHETELDRTLLEALKGPLTHLVRNSLDHGIEAPAERERLGKPIEGRLFLRAFHESGQVVIEISDDGKGLDVEKIAQVALSRGVVSGEQLRRMEPREIQALIFQPGFSTADTVTNVSGRGVGMDVVRTNIERIGGSVDLSSQPGKGTTCRVRIPLTLAIIPALLIDEGTERYAIPQANLVELVRLESDDVARHIEDIAGSRVLRLRGHLLPLVTLAETLGVQAPRVETGLTIVVVQCDDLRFGLAVAGVHDTQEIVVKPIGRQLKALPMYAGATILGDGRVSLILDVAGIASANAIELVTTESLDERRVESDDSTSLLVLEISHGSRAALPLREISRLEEFAASAVERSGAREVVQYRGGIMPLIRLAPSIGLPETPRDPEANVSVIVHEDDGRYLGIVIDQVLDVVDAALFTTDAGRRPGVLGSAVVQGRVTDLVDLDAVLTRGEVPVG